MTPPQRFAETRQESLLIGMFAGAWQFVWIQRPPTPSIHQKISASTLASSIALVADVTAADRFACEEIAYP